MADRIETATVTATAGTATDAPTTVDCSFPAGTVTAVEIVVPPGHAGLTTLALAQGGQQVIPSTPGGVIVADDEVIHWPLDGFINNGDWSAIVSNADVYDHSWYLRFLVEENVNDIPAPSLPLAGVTP